MSLEWKSCKIGDVVSVRRGSSPRPIKDYVSETGMPWVKIADATKDQTRFINFTSEFIKEEGIEKSVVVNPGDLIVSNSATPGLPKFMNIKACVHDGWLVFDSYNGILKDFLYYYFIVIRGRLVNQANGSVFKNLKTDIVRNFDINLPDLETQEKIVKILSQIDKKIETTIKINKNLEEQLSLIFDDIFVKCSQYEKEALVKTDWGYIPKDWKNVDFADLIQITSGDRPDEKSEVKTSEFNIPLFGASKIMGYTKESSYNEKILIIGRVGTHGVIQRVNYPCFPSDNTFVIKSEYYGFVYQLLKRIDYDSLNTGSTQPLITQKSLKTVNVILPDEKTLFNFEKISDIFFDKIYIINNEIRSLTKLRDTLLPKLMSGEIDVTKINCDLKIIIRKIYIKSSKLFLWRYLSENKNYIKNTKSNETLLKSRTIYKINKFLAKFNARYRYYRQ